MYAASSANPPVIFLSGPPAGGELFRAVIDRLGQGEAISVVDPATPSDGWRQRADVLAHRIERGRTVVVAHGLAVPAAVAAALEVPPAALVLCNGPVTRLDPVSRSLAALAGLPGGLLARTLLRPGPWLAWLASSAGLRRTVVNPYAMDRDTVALLCRPGVATPEGRRATAAFLSSLVEGLPDARALTCPTLLVWADEDPLYPASEADWIASALPTARHLAVPGARFYFPEERPWLVADALRELLPDHASGAGS